jgi:hypothetical protein
MWLVDAKQVEPMGNALLMRRADHHIVGEAEIGKPC